MKQTEYHFIVEQDDESRVDKFLTDRLPDISRSQIKGFIESGNVTLDGEVVYKAGSKTRIGDAITIRVPEDDSDGLVPEELPLDIIYEDHNVIVINKEAGQVVHPGAGNFSGTLVNALLAHFPPIRNVGEEERPGEITQCFHQSNHGATRNHTITPTTNSQTRVSGINTFHPRRMIWS